MNLADLTDEGNSAVKPGSNETFVREKVRIRFRKDGPLRFISHNDLLRCWDRLVRRSGLPIRFSEGFNPKPRFSSPLALGVGLIGYEEILELELTENLESARIQEILEQNTVEGLSIVSVTIHPAKEQTRVVSLEYTCPIPEGRPVVELRQCASNVLAATTLPILRRNPKKPERVVDLRPFLQDLIVTEQRVEFRIRVLNGSTARAEELLELLGLDQSTPPVVLTRSRVELG